MNGCREVVERRSVEMELVPRQKVAWSKRKKPKISIKRGNPIRVRVKYREKDRSHKIK